jgi:protein tyrosine/serine phosphatase
MRGGSRASSAAPPTPSPPQSERSSPATVMGAKEQGQVPASQALVTPVVAPAFPLNYSLPVLTAPPQFGQVEPFLYRSGRFHDLHAPFLATLHLKSIVYLSNPAEYPLNSAMKNFVQEHGVEVLNAGAIVFGSAAAHESVVEWGDSHASSSTAFLTLHSELARLALEHLLLASNAPCLIMCHNGVELTSLLIGCLRRMQGWTFTSVIDEFTRVCTALQLREEGGKRGHMQTPSSLLQSTVGPTGALRYAYTSNLSNDLQRHYRFEEFMELFDLNSVRVPTSTTNTPHRKESAQQNAVQLQCVEWYRRLKRAERREAREQRKIRRAKSSLQPPTLIAPDTAVGQQPVPGLVALTEDQTTTVVPTVAPPPSSTSAVLSLAPWATDLRATFHSSRLVSGGVRIDPKESLVDEDED